MSHQNSRHLVVCFLEHNKVNFTTYWSQKCTQNSNINSKELYVYVEKQSASNLSLSFYPNSSKVGNITLSLVPPSQLVSTGMILGDEVDDPYPHMLE